MPPMPTAVPLTRLTHIASCRIEIGVGAGVGVATGVGLVMYGYRNSIGEHARAPVGAGALVRVAGRLRGLFKEFF